MLLLWNESGSRQIFKKEVNEYLQMARTTVVT